MDNFSAYLDGVVAQLVKRLVRKVIQLLGLTWTKACMGTGFSDFEMDPLGVNRPPISAAGV